jgi:5-oxopent-3-ene-1,2,5-tricarboxylate decarboxylase/2-hydroxyhepta-2,4-diene-1,7-dioate isomerase
MYPASTAAALPPAPRFEVPPHRLSGVVYGVLMNDPQALAALGDAVHQAPYKAPPKAPVMYMKPRNTLAADGSTVIVPADAGAFTLGASLGIVLGRTACRVDERDALAHVAGYLIVADLSVPHDSFYRPSVRYLARDGSCLIGPQVVPRDAVPDPEALGVTVTIDGAVVQRTDTRGMRRGVARLLADVTEFMTLRAGDLLLFGVRAGAPRILPGQRFGIAIDGLGTLHGATGARSDA